MGARSLGAQVAVEPVDPVLSSQAVLGDPVGGTGASIVLQPVATSLRTACSPGLRAA